MDASISLEILTRKNVKDAEPLMRALARYHGTVYQGDTERFAGDLASIPYLKGFLVKRHGRAVAYSVYTTGVSAVGEPLLYFEDAGLDPTAYRKPDLVRRMFHEVAWRTPQWVAGWEWTTASTNKSFQRLVGDPSWFGARASNTRNYNITALIRSSGPSHRSCYIENEPDFSTIVLPSKRHLTPYQIKLFARRLEEVGLSAKHVLEQQPSRISGFVTIDRQTGATAAVTLWQDRYATFRSQPGAILRHPVMSGDFDHPTVTKILASIVSAVGGYVGGLSRPPCHISWFVDQDSIADGVLENNKDVTIDRIGDTDASDLLPFKIDRHGLSRLRRP